MPSIFKLAALWAAAVSSVSSTPVALTHRASSDKLVFCHFMVRLLEPDMIQVE
jgi:hypothetical protein